MATLQKELGVQCKVYTCALLLFIQKMTKHLKCIENITGISELNNDLGTIDVLKRKALEIWEDTNEVRMVMLYKKLAKMMYKKDQSPAKAHLILSAFFHLSYGHTWALGGLPPPRAMKLAWVGVCERV